MTFVISIQNTCSAGLSFSARSDEGFSLENKKLWREERQTEERSVGLSVFGSILNGLAMDTCLVACCGFHLEASGSSIPYPSLC